MVDYTSISGEFWFFHSALTHLPYVLTVTDHATGAVKQYGSAGPFCGEGDTAAFAGSPTPHILGDGSGGVHDRGLEW